MRKLIVLLLLSAFLGSHFIRKTHTKSYIIATATPGGTYYPVGVAIGALVTIKLHPGYQISATAITSAGSGENIHMLNTKEADFAILQALFGATAYRGERNYQGKPVRDIRSITVLWENVEHFVLLKRYAKTGNIEDLHGLHKSYSIGKRGSGTEGSGEVILSALGINVEEDISMEYLGYNASVQSIIDGRIAGANMPAGIPASAVTQLFAQLGKKRITILQLSDSQLEKIRTVYPIWTRYTIPSNSYPGQNHEVHTIAQSNFLACRADMSEEYVYLVTKTIYENLPYLRNIHQSIQAMDLKKSISGLPIPLHPGAVKYYRECGLSVPDELLLERNVR